MSDTNGNTNGTPPPDRAWHQVGYRLPRGGTLLTPLAVTETGEIYLAARLSEEGREFVALYLASRTASLHPAGLQSLRAGLRENRPFQAGQR